MAKGKGPITSADVLDLHDFFKANPTCTLKDCGLDLAGWLCLHLICRAHPGLQVVFWEETASMSPNSVACPLCATYGYQTNVGLFEAHPASTACPTGR